MTAILKVTNLSVELNQKQILKNVNFEVWKNETIAVIGPNGAGKTVLFRALLGFIPYKGKIEWQENIKVGYVPQKLLINSELPLTVSEFLKLKEKSQEKINDALFSVGFKEKGWGVLKSKLGVLSGGELQRILIAWALLGQPDVLLFDEPTSGVDVSAEKTIYELLHNLKEKHGLTIMLISHELNVVYKYTDRVICLNKETICTGTPKEVLDSKSMARLFGEDVSFYHHLH